MHLHLRTRGIESRRISSLRMHGSLFQNEGSTIAKLPFYIVAFGTGKQPDPAENICGQVRITLNYIALYSKVEHNWPHPHKHLKLSVFSHGQPMQQVLHDIVRYISNWNGHRHDHTSESH